MQRFVLFGLLIGSLAAPAAALPPEGDSGGSATAPGAAPAETSPAVPAAPTEDQRAQAREHFRRGKRLLDRNHPEEALEEFGASYALFPHWATSNAMGACHDQLNRPNDALRLYQQALREGGDDIPHATRLEIEQRVAALRVQLGIPDVTTGTIRVTTSPPGATVRLDGGDAGLSPVDLAVSPGPHHIDVALDGYQPGGMDVAVELGQTVVQQFALVAAAMQPRTGRLACTSEPGGVRVLVDGTAVGRTPAELAAVDAGDHLVRFEADDGRTMEEHVMVPADGTARVSVSFGGGIDRGWFWGLAGTAVALGAGAAGTGAYGTVLWNEFNDGTTTYQRKQDIQPLGRSLMTTTDVLASVAGALAASALVIAFFTDFGDEPGRIDIGYEGPPAPVEPPPPDAVEPPAPSALAPPSPVAVAP